METEYRTHNNDEVTHAQPAKLVRISWGSILAGSLVGLAILVVLTLLGFSIGFGVVDPSVDDNPLSGVGIGSAFWATAIMIASLFIAGFVAARMAGQPNTTTAMLHGVTVWSLVTIVIIWLAGTAVGGLIGGTVSTISSSASAMGTAISQAASYTERQVSQIDFQEVLPSQLPPELQNRLEARGLTVANFRTEFRQAIANSALGQKDLGQLRENARETVREIVQNPRDYQSIISDFVDNLAGSGTDVVISESERTQIVDRLVQRTGITRSEAENYIDQAVAKVKQVRQNVVQVFEQAQEQAVQGVEAALDGLTKAALWSFVGLMLALIAAAAGSAIGAPRHLPHTRI